jgi:hypothetical protein
MFHVDKDPHGRKRIITGGDGCRIAVSGFFRTAVLSWWWCKVAKDFLQFLFSSLSLSLSLLTTVIIMHRLTGLASSLGFFSIFPDQTQKVERSKNVLDTSIQKNDADGSCAEEEEKLEFLEKYGNQYGYPESTTPIDELRSKEFARLAGKCFPSSPPAVGTLEFCIKNSSSKDVNS